MIRESKNSEWGLIETHSQVGPPLPDFPAVRRSPSTPGFNALRWRFACLTALATLGLLGAGGLVTSHGAGLAVPDWPNTYGYNLFFFPVSQWMGGIFYEHTHRLLAAAVGLMTSVLALWLYGRRARRLMRWLGAGAVMMAVGAGLARPRRWSDAVVLGLAGLALWGGSRVWPRCEPAARWLRRMGLWAFLAVVLQGVLGGLRVVLLRDQLGIFHALLAQLFFVLVCAIALCSSRWWQELRAGGAWVSGGEGHGRDARATGWFAAGTLLIVAQLLLGATMRHQHAGLAIPDFPLAYGKLWPPMDAASVALYNQHRLEVVAMNPITGFQIGLQMAHRITALLILGVVAYGAWLTRGRGEAWSMAGKLALCWLVLIVGQAGLGAATIWTDKAADVATAHVLVGALSLALGAMLWLAQARGEVSAAVAERVGGREGVEKAERLGGKDVAAPGDRRAALPALGGYLSRHSTLDTGSC